MIGVANDAGIQDVAAEEALVTIVMIASKALSLPVVVKTPLRSDAPPFGVRENIACFGRRLHTIDRRDGRPGVGRGIHEAHDIGPSGALIDGSRLPCRRFHLHGRQRVLPSNAAIARELPFVPNDIILLHGRIKEAVVIPIVLLLVG